MKSYKLLISFLLALIARSSDGQWVRLMEFDSAFIPIIKFFEDTPTPMTGFAVVADFKGNSNIFRTFDGGLTWEKQVSPQLLNSAMISIAIKDRSKIWMGGGLGTVNGDFIYSSTDVGATWSPTGSFLCFANGMEYNQLSRLLILSGDNQTSPNTYTSRDEGVTWQKIFPSSFGFIEATTGFSFNSDNIGILGCLYPVTTPSPIVSYYKTTDAGSTWNSIGIIDESWQPLAIKETGTFFIASEITGNILRSDDTGSTWDTLYSFPERLLTGCIVGDLCHLYVQAVSTGLFESTDQGKSWNLINDLRNGRDTRFYFYNNVLYASDYWDGLKPASLWRLTLPPNKPTMIAPDITFALPMCQTVDTVLRFGAFNQCDGEKVILDTLYVEGSPAINITHNGLWRSIDWDTIRIRYVPDDAVNDTAIVHLRFRLKGNTFDTSLTIYGSVSSHYEHITLHPSLSKSQIGTSEVTMLEVRSDKDVSQKGLERIEFDLELNTDVLGAANYNSPYGNITVGAEQRIGKTSRIPITITGSDISINANTPLVTFTLQPFVSDTMQTDITITNVRLNGGDADYERCTLSADGSGASFTLAAICGDSLLSKLLGGKRLADILWLRPNPTRGDVEVSYRTERDGLIRFDIIDDLGRIIASHQIESRTGTHTYTLPLMGISNGSYHLLLTSGTTTSTARFVKQ